MALQWYKGDTRVSYFPTCCSSILYGPLTVLQEMFTSTFNQYTKSVLKRAQNTGKGDGNVDTIVVWQTRTQLILIPTTTNKNNVVSHPNIDVGQKLGIHAH